MITHHWPRVRERAAEWGQRFADRVEVLEALGSQFTREKRYADARRCLASCVRMAPTEWTYTQLADTYRLEGNTAKWLETLDEFLNLADSEWSQRDVQVKIARHFIRLGQFDRALPYAAASARTGSSAAALTAAECHEYLRQYAKAEQYLRGSTDSYPEAPPLQWLQFCLRTGHGDLPAARAAALEIVEEAAQSPDTDNADSSQPSELSWIAQFFLLDGQHAKALDSFELSYKSDFNVFDALHAALLAEQLGKHYARDSALRLIAKKGPSDESKGRVRAEMIEFARLWQNSLSPTGGPLDPATLDKLLANAPLSERLSLLYFVARWLELRGDRASARRYLIDCASIPIPKLNRTLACMALRRRGQEPNDLPLRAVASPAAATAARP
jgi:tetratricopeptide (TPR) repeat protein